MTISELKLIIKVLGSMCEKHPLFWLAEATWVFLCVCGILAVTVSSNPESGFFILTVAAIYHGAIFVNAAIIAARIGASKIVPMVDPRWHLMKPDYKAIEGLEADTKMDKTVAGEVVD